MARLTEEMVIARSKQSDLAAIKKLNCWGSELSDVSIIRRMRGVEVLAFSVNRISTLADFENCINLQELYLRKNNLTDIDELVYLQNLPKLKFLWLEENPLVELAGPGYRQIVLRALPNLKKLDNVDVSPEEVAEAMRAPVAQPQQRHEVYENPSPPPPVQHQQTSPQQQQQQYRQQSPVIERSPPNRDCYSPPSQAQNSHASSHYNTNNHRGSYQQYDEYYQSDYQRQNPPAHYRHSQMDLTEWDESSSAAHHQNNNNNGGQNSSNSHHQQQQQQQQQQQHHGQSNYQQNRRSIAGSTVNERELYQYRNGNGKGPESRDEWEDVDRRRNENRRSDSRFNDSASVISNALLNHFAGVHRRPVSRNSNLLSATLCLVKELDYPSLEVVEHAVRCRIDELAE
ncbi:cilia- and flagella-associated protein 410 isoform X5 [Anopheles gambiae]|uniref:cilia- and flagella-associated protein 410 isoform X5 n=1 Tax=Anopheles gambiae TaxID=7165 RepID=UPI002AC8CBC7|nr:cilia- and flagella-associated protein 410 isoform X5 [Anopheles gambiae]XP_061502495.1 cilia- and flagella-associated protein 410 isoform X5 [Anopheles gambiae]